MLKHRLSLVAFVIAAASLAGGCSTDKSLNPSFKLTVEEAREAMREMKAGPKALQRPVLVLGGYLDPGVVAGGVAVTLKRCTGDQRVVTTTFMFADTFEACRDRALASLEKKFPSDDPDETIEVDVVAVSMGGLVARFASLGADADGEQAVSTEAEGKTTARPKRLRIARLYTISTPHRGADMATLPTFTQTQIDMRIGSPFLKRLNEASAQPEYELVCYVRIGDAIVGAANAAPRGMQAWWVPNKPLEGAHLAAGSDDRILADILRRLRGETPFTTSPPAPLPAEDDQADAADTEDTQSAEEGLTTDRTD